MSILRKSGERTLNLLLMMTLALTMTAHPAASETVSELRRATIRVDSIEAVLPFYTELLGLNIRYDQTVTDPAQLSLIGLADGSARVIALESSRQPKGGTVGLVEILTPRQAALGKQPARVSLLFLIEDAAKLHAKLRAAGIRQLSELQTYSESLGTTHAFTVEDPSGISITIAEIVGN